MDSSALVKLVIEEPESEALQAYLPSDAVLATSMLADVEVLRACKLANPSREVEQDADRLLASCLRVAVGLQLLGSARALVSPKLRTLDAIHLASALRIEADELLAYDNRLLAAADEQGMRVGHPTLPSIPTRPRMWRASA